MNKQMLKAGQEPQDFFFFQLPLFDHEVAQPD